MDAQFDSIWGELEAEGKCDGLGGAQYRRILQQWQSWARPSEIVDLILYEANCQPDAPPWTPPGWELVYESESEADADSDSD